jgi:hypothetical protein
VGQLIVLEMPQTLYNNGQDPHFSQGFFKGTIARLGQLQQGMLRKVELQVEDALLPGSLAFYSTSTYRRLQRIPPASRQLAEQLYQRTGSELCTVTVASGRYGLFGSCAAAADRATEAWVVGQNAVQRALQAISGPAKQLYLFNSSSGSSSSSSKEECRTVSVLGSKAVTAAEHDNQQQQQPVPMQT